MRKKERLSCWDDDVFDVADKAFLERGSLLVQRKNVMGARDDTVGSGLINRTCADIDSFDQNQLFFDPKQKSLSCPCATLYCIIVGEKHYNQH
jgi:hypothetical protein